MAELRTDNLSISYRDTGPRNGKAALLLHGWPDDDSSWDAVAENLNVRGLRTVMPALRGVGATRFLSEETPRTADIGILAMDAITLMDRLGIEDFSVAGHDWGANVAEALAVGWPGRVQSLAMLAGPSRLGKKARPPLSETEVSWRRWFQSARRRDPKRLAYSMWRTASPARWFDDATFERVAHSFENPDWVDVTVHSYRARMGEVPVDARSRWLEEKIHRTETLSLPAIYFQGESDGVYPPDSVRDTVARFKGAFEYVLMRGVGHFPSREAPRRVADGLAEVFGGC